MGRRRPYMTLIASVVSFHCCRSAYDGDRTNLFLTSILLSHHCIENQSIFTLFFRLSGPILLYIFFSFAPLLSILSALSTLHTSTSRSLLILHFCYKCRGRASPRPNNEATSMRLPICWSSLSKIPTASCMPCMLAC